MARQLSFDLPLRPALGRDAFIVSQCNAMALGLIDACADWPNGKLLLTGPKGAGKTHLAHVWAEQRQARIIAASALEDADIEALAGGAICVEDVQDIAGARGAETALFHLHNLALAQGQPLLLTAIGAPRDWGLVLPDLASRLQGTTLTTIAPPDDALLFALYMKLFEDRQIAPAPDVIPYLADHAPRTFDSAAAIVEDLDRKALDTKRKLSRAMAVEILAAHVAENPPG